jgi:hypothetical protein
MANQRNLKAFVRFDGSGRIVAGSLILRKQKPKVGRWYEIPAYQCCNDVPTELFFTVASLPMNYPGVTIYCDEVQVDYEYVHSATSLTTIDELVESLNTAENTRQFGTYSNAGEGIIKLIVPLSVKNRLCPNGTLAFTVYPD